MKKLFAVIAVLSLAFSLVSCKDVSESKFAMKEEGIAPYQLSEEGKYILESFNMQRNSKLISFNAPKEAITMNINLYRLKDGKWEKSSDGGGISIGSEREPVDRIQGTLALTVNQDDHSIDYVINCGGTFSSYFSAAQTETETSVSAFCFLEELKTIELNKEIPVLISVYDSGSSMPAFSVDRFDDPSRLEDKDLVQALTVTFTENDL